MAIFDRNLYTIKLIFLPNRDPEENKVKKANNRQNGRRKTVTNPNNYSTPKEMIPPSPHRVPKPKAKWLGQNQESAKKIPQEDSRKA